MPQARDSSPVRRQVSLGDLAKKQTPPPPPPLGPAPGHGRPEEQDSPRALLPAVRPQDGAGGAPRPPPPGNNTLLREAHQQQQQQPADAGGDSRGSSLPQTSFASDDSTGKGTAAAAAGGGGGGTSAPNPGALYREIELLIRGSHITVSQPSTTTTTASLLWSH